MLNANLAWQVGVRWYLESDVADAIAVEIWASDECCALADWRGWRISFGKNQICEKTERNVSQISVGKKG